MTPETDLTARNTLGLASRARFALSVKMLPDLTLALDHAAEIGVPFHALGGGSNVVLAPDIDAVVGLIDMQGTTVDDSRPDDILITAAAGESWPDLVDRTVAQGIGGLENLAGVPGTVGAAPIQNIGAYGRELSEVFDHLTALDTHERRPVKMSRDDCAFRYRHSLFKDEPGRFVVMQVTLRLPRDWRPVTSYAGLENLADATDPDTIRRRVLALRADKTPDWRDLGNAGSFFHNPVVPDEPRFADIPGHATAGGRKLSAGWLIETVGLKGHRIGGAGFSQKHALFVVNHGGATFEDVQALSALAHQRVRERFGVDLVQEPVVLG